MLTKKREQELKNQGYDLDFIERIKPQGGITFSNNMVTQTGDGYSACLHVHSIPGEVPPFWLMDLTENLGTVTTMHIATADKDRVVSAIDRTLSEYNDRMDNERTYTARNDAYSEFMNLQEFAQKITQGGEIIKLLHLRIFLSADTLEELENQKMAIRKKLASKNYKATTFLFEEKEEWLSLFESSSEQAKHFNAREGIAIPSNAIGGGYPFNHQVLIDSPSGGYIGTTDTNGAFIFNPFQVTKNRASFSGIAVGMSGYGKSSLLKMIEEILNGRNTFIRGFEKNGDWFNTIQHQGGKILDLSGQGADGIINPMEVFATKTDKTGLHLDALGSYMQHRAKFMNQVRFLDPDMGNVDQLVFSEIFDEFYMSRGLLERNYMRQRDRIQVTGLASSQYPIIQEFRDFYYNFIDQERFRYGTNEQSRALEKFGTVINSMCTTYGALFNGHTTLKDFSNEKIVFYDIDGIANLEKPLFNSQLFTALTLTWNQAMLNGRKMKTLIERREIAAEDATYFMFFLDECQNIINLNNYFAVEYVVDFLKEMRKFSAGAYLATQSPQELLPEGTTDVYISKIKQIYELCATKIFLHLDDSVIGRMKDVLGSGLKESDYDMMRKLEKGQALFNLGSGETYKVNVDPSVEQLERFTGGH